MTPYMSKLLASLEAKKESIKIKVFNMVMPIKYFFILDLPKRKLQVGDTVYYPGSIADGFSILEMKVTMRQYELVIRGLYQNFFFERKEAEKESQRRQAYFLYMNRREVLS